jgi:hypothetical protein
VFPDPSPSNIRPIVVRVGSHGKMFTESLPSIESIRHNMFACPVDSPVQAGTSQPIFDIERETCAIAKVSRPPYAHMYYVCMCSYITGHGLKPNLWVAREKYSKKQRSSGSICIVGGMVTHCN